MLAVVPLVWWLAAAPAPADAAGAPAPADAAGAPAPANASAAPARPAAVPTQELAQLGGDVKSAVALAEQHGWVEESSGRPVLRLRARVTSSLPVPVRSVSVGILFADDAARLAGIDGAALYRRGRPEAEGGVGSVVERVPVQLAGRGETRIDVARPLDPGLEPTAFVTHVLGYELGDASAGLLLDLLSTQSAADEVAAVDLLALDGDRAARLEARRRWSSRARQLVPGLAGVLDRAAPERPGEAETFRRVYAALALGVLGGDTAERTLRRQLADPALARFDEPLQVLRIARVVGSPLETPLAFAVPAGANRMTDVVAHALEESLRLDEEPGSAVPGAAGSPRDVAGRVAEGSELARQATGSGAAAGRPGAGAEQSRRGAGMTPTWVVAIVTGLAAGAVLWLVVGLGRRRRAASRDGGSRR